jgi:CopG family transcriptional regulator / antitoxin EndoAI
MARVLISMDDEFLDMVDAFASREHRTRSELIREALRTYIRRTGTLNPQRAETDAASLTALLADDV